MVQSKISVAVLGVLGFAMLLAVIWQQSNPHYPHYQPLWQETLHTDRAAPSRPSHALLHKHSHEGAGLYTSPGKPGTEVSLLSDAQQSLPLLQTSQVKLQLQSHLTQGQLRVTLETSPQLQLLNGAAEVVFDLEQGRPLELPLALRAETEGLHHVHMFIEHRDPSGISTARALAAEFRVGAAPMEKLFDKQVTLADADRLISLPGRESIR
jgi:hypothetical protein